MGDSELLSEREVEAAVPPPWRVVDGQLTASYQTGDMVTGGGFVAKIIEAAEDANHHPDVDLRYSSVTLRLMTHDADGLTQADVDLARKLADLARHLDLTPLA